MTRIRLVAALAVLPFAASACADAPTAPLSPDALPAEASVSYSVGISGPGYVYDDWAHFTATPSPSGTYWYQWDVMYCFNGWEPSDCDWTWKNSWKSGTNETSFSKWIGRGECWSRVRVSIRASSGGPVLAQNETIVYGAGEWVGSPGSPAPGCW